jgi:alpha-L-fucosidase
MKTARARSVRLDPGLHPAGWAQPQASDEAAAESKVAADKDRDRRFAWFREARFGLFIHWGLYAVPAGEWQGKPIAGIGEWIMNRAKHPDRRLRAPGQAVQPGEVRRPGLGADGQGRRDEVPGHHLEAPRRLRHVRLEGVPLRHRRGHALRPRSDEGAGGRVQEGGIKLGFYYSQDQDWHESEASGNFWSFPPDNVKKVLGRNYFDGKVKAQVREILTQYGPIGLIWFDTPKLITKQQSRSWWTWSTRSSRTAWSAGGWDTAWATTTPAGDNQISVSNARPRLGDAGHPQRHLGLQEERQQLEAGGRAPAPAHRGGQPGRQLPA